MKPDPIVEELWKIKDDLAREANYDTHRFFEILRQWESEHALPGRVITGPEELRALMAEAQSKKMDAGALLLKDQSDKI